MKAEDLNVTVHDDVKSQSVFGAPKAPVDQSIRKPDDPNRAERRAREAIARKQAKRNN